MLRFPRFPPGPGALRCAAAVLPGPSGETFEDRKIKKMQKTRRSPKGGERIVENEERVSELLLSQAQCLCLRRGPPRLLASELFKTFQNFSRRPVLSRGMLGHAGALWARLSRYRLHLKRSPEPHKKPHFVRGKTEQRASGSFSSWSSRNTQVTPFTPFTPLTSPSRLPRSPHSPPVPLRRGPSNRKRSKALTQFHCASGGGGGGTSEKCCAPHQTADSSRFSP